MRECPPIVSPSAAQTHGASGIAARRVVSLSGLLVGWIVLIGPPRRLLVLSKMSGWIHGGAWGGSS